jgi:hypothetical protein
MMLITGLHDAYIFYNRADRIPCLSVHESSQATQGRSAAIYRAFPGGFRKRLFIPTPLFADTIPALSRYAVIVSRRPDSL